MMKTKTAVILIMACSVIVGLLGAAGGGEYVMRRVDAMDAVQKTQRDAREQSWKDALAREDQSLGMMNQNYFACQEKFQETTVIYERAPQITLGFSGFRGLPVIPIGAQGDEAPHWIIPARIQPKVLGDPRGAVYYYMNRENRMDGPYIPEAVRAQ